MISLEDEDEEWPRRPESSESFIARNIALFFVVSVVLIAAAVGLTFWLCKDKAGQFVNLVSIVLIVVFVLLGIGIRRNSGLFPLVCAIRDLSRMTDKLCALEKEDNLDRAALAQRFQTWFRQPNHEADSAIAQNIERYWSDMNGNFGNADAAWQYCDISDYINEDLLDKIGHASYNEMVGAILTGTGILGTFVGLVFGLSDFNVAEIESTLDPLIAGIKVAFLTSIYGMVSSVIFNLYYKKLIDLAVKKQHEFINKFYKIIKSPSEREGWTQLVGFQSEQNDTLKHLAEMFAQKVSDIFSKNIVPVMQECLSDVRGLTEQMSRHQSQSIEKLANDFVVQMNQAMGSNMTALGDSMANASAKMKELCGALENVTTGTQKNCEVLSETVNQLNTSMEKLSDFVSDIKSTANTIHQQLERTMASFVLLMEDIEKINNSLDDTGQRMQETSAGLGEQIQKQLEANDAVLLNIQRCIEEFKEHAGNLNGTLVRMVESQTHLRELVDADMEKAHSNIDRLLADCITHFNGTINDMKNTLDETNNATNRLTNAAVSAAEKMTAVWKSSATDFQNTMKAIEAGLKKMEEEFPQIVQTSLNQISSKKTESNE